MTVGDQPVPLEANDPEGTVASFDVVSGDLPQGLVLNSDGTFGGQASEEGTFELVLSVCEGGQPDACSLFELHLTIIETVEHLPFTGAETGSLMMMGLVLIVSGGGLVLRMGERTTEVV